MSVLGSQDRACALRPLDDRAHLINIDHRLLGKDDTVMPPGNLEDWVALALLRGVGPIALHRALARYGDPGEIAYRLSPSAWLSLRGVGPETVRSIHDSRLDLAKSVDREIRLCRKHAIQIVPLHDPDYPAALRELPDAPVVLYVLGSLPERVVRVALVGSRRATAYGRRIAVGLGSALAARGIEVVSGGARGIDTHAHRGALEAEGRTVAVLGSGLLEPYPRENRELFETIAGSGAVVSEFPLEAPPLAEHFPRRNRLISGLSAAVVVVEAAPRSGAVAFLLCHPERTKNPTAQLATGAEDPR